MPQHDKEVPPGFDPSSAPAPAPVAPTALATFFEANGRRFPLGYFNDADEAKSKAQSIVQNPDVAFRDTLMAYGGEAGSAIVDAIIQGKLQVEETAAEKDLRGFPVHKLIVRVAENAVAPQAALEEAPAAISTPSPAPASPVPEPIASAPEQTPPSIPEPFQTPLTRPTDTLGNPLPPQTDLSPAPAPQVHTPTMDSEIAKIIESMHGKSSAGALADSAVLSAPAPLASVGDEIVASISADAAPVQSPAAPTPPEPSAPPVSAMRTMVTDSLMQHTDTADAVGVVPSPQETQAVAPPVEDLPADTEIAHAPPAPSADDAIRDHYEHFRDSLRRPQAEADALLREVWDTASKKQGGSEPAGDVLFSSLLDVQHNLKMRVYDDRATGALTLALSDESGTIKSTAEIVNDDAKRMIRDLVRFEHEIGDTPSGQHNAA